MLKLFSCKIVRLSDLVKGLASALGHSDDRGISQAFPPATAGKGAPGSVGAAQLRIVKEVVVRVMLSDFRAETVCVHAELIALLDVVAASEPSGQDASSRKLRCQVTIHPRADARQSQKSIP